MFFELREYRIAPGRRDEFAAFMDEVIVPFQRAKGMDVVGTFVSLEEDDLYVWIRRFESEEQRQALYDAVYGDARWIDELRPAMKDMLIRESIRVRRLAATPKSPL
jgi:hypothetical protein